MNDRKERESQERIMNTTMEDVMEETDNSVVLYFAGSDNDNESDDEGDVFHDIDVDDDEGTTITTAANETSVVEVKNLDELTVIIRAHDDDDDDDIMHE
mmetsp:Transcript_38259/g.43716  ORF Transcript_38259/g.43716 Transcript_38259/m.43716 type:complete len:99 (+) Transcript_38259:104-400(+)